MRTIQILVALLLIENSCCQDGFNDGNMVGYQQMASNEGQIETITSYSTNILQRDPKSQSISSVNVQYRITDDSNKNVDAYNKAYRGRSKKVYRIKNPFINKFGDVKKNEENTDLNDSGTAASNQYAAVRYSLPPEEFLQQMRVENQYNQQQQQQILSTPIPNLGYTATPQPQSQVSTISKTNYDSNNEQSNKFYLDPKIAQAYLSNLNYQFNPTSTFGVDVIQSTPSSGNSYLSVPHLYLSTPVYPYVSSSSPIILSSPSNFQSYVSSPMTSIQATSPDYTNRITPTISTNSQYVENSDSNKNMQVDHYDNMGNGIKYSVNTHQQYQNNYPSSTSMPLSTPYADNLQDSGQSTINSGLNALSKSLQELTFSKFQNNPYKDNQQEAQSNNNVISMNSETHRMGNIPSANNVYLNYVQPDSQIFNALKSRSRDSQPNSNQQDMYSNGDYGWKLNDKKPLSNIDSYLTENYPRYSGSISQSDSGAVSQINFQMNTGKNYNSELYTKSNLENNLAHATVKSQDNFKQQQQFYNSNSPSTFIGNNQQGQNIGGNVFFEDSERNKYKYTGGSNHNIYSFSSSPPELITITPSYNGNSKDITLDNKPKPTFDHAKALQNIIPIGVSNVVPNTDSQSKSYTGLENINRYNVGKEHLDPNLKQYYRTLMDSFYKDKNTFYGFNIKTKPEDFQALDYLRPLEIYAPYSNSKQQSHENSYDPNTFVSTTQTLNYTPQGSINYQDNIQSPASFQQQELSQPQNPSDILTILKLNDGPHQATQGLASGDLRLQSSNFGQDGMPSPLPVKLNQNLGSHQLDVNSNTLNKVMLYNQHRGNFNRPELDAITSINGFKVANPFNIDLRLVADMLKGKPTLGETHTLTLKDQFNKQTPLKFDLSQLQLLLRNENSGNLESLSDSLSAYSNPYVNVYGSRQFPYQGVKYSRSQEEEEGIIPIAESSNTHPIGSVVEQVDIESENDITTGSDMIATGDENGETNFDDDGTKKSTISSHNGIVNRHRHPNALISGRHTYRNKYPVEEPYPLLKPPPLQSSRYRGNQMKVDRYRRRRRLIRPKIIKVLKSEPLYEDESAPEQVEEPIIPILLRPPPPNAEDKSDTEQTS